MLHRVVEKACCDKTCRVSHIYQEDSTDFVSQFAYASVVPFAAVSTCTGDNQFWTFCTCLFFHFFVVHATCFSIYSVADRTEVKTREVYRATVAEVTTVAEVHTHECVARFEASHEYSHVSLSTTVRLYVCPFSVEELLSTFDSEVFNFVYHLATTIVAVCRITFSIFVCEA